MPSNYDAHAQAVADGVLEAWKIYGRWSQNFYVHDEGIEAFLSVKIAETLHERFADVCLVQLEAPVERLQKKSGAVLRAGRYPQALRRSGRVDVAFSDKSGRPVGIVEVKRHFSGSNWQADLDRIVAMLDRFGAENGGSLRWGALAAMHTIWSRNKDNTSTRLERKAKKLRNSEPTFRIQSSMAEEMLASPTQVENNYLLGAAGLCLLITPL